MENRRINERNVFDYKIIDCVLGNGQRYLTLLFARHLAAPLLYRGKIADRANNVIFPDIMVVDGKK